MFDRKRAVEKARAKRVNQERSLQETLNEIEYVEKNAPESTALIRALRVKRDRQELAIRATDEQIKIYEAPDPAQKDLLEDKKKGR